MPRNRDLSDLSELEREFELEMDDEYSEDREWEDDLQEAEEEEELEQELEGLEQEADIYGEAEEDLEQEAEGIEEDREREFVERFLELSAKEFESEAEVGEAMNAVLDGMAREYFFGKIARGIKSGIDKAWKSKLVRGLVKKGLAAAAGRFPAFQAALKLAKGDLQGAILNLGRQALGTTPGGAAALGAMKALGFEASEDPEGTARRYVRLSREAFEHLADNLTENADQPQEAARLASNAYQHALRRARARAPGSRLQTPRSRFPTSGRRRVLRLRVARGQRIKLIITGE